MGHLDAFRLKDISECTPWTLVQPAWRTNIALSKCKRSCTREGAGGVFSGCDLECLSSAEQCCTRGCYTHANYHVRCAVRCQCSHLSEAIAHKQWQTWTTKTKQTEKKNVMSSWDGPRWSYEQLKLWKLRKHSQARCEAYGTFPGKSCLGSRLPCHPEGVLCCSKCKISKVKSSEVRHIPPGCVGNPKLHKLDQICLLQPWCW